MNGGTDDFRKRQEAELDAWQEIRTMKERKKKRKEMDQSLDAYLYGIGGQKEREEALAALERAKAVQEPASVMPTQPTISGRMSLAQKEGLFDRYSAQPEVNAYTTRLTEEQTAQQEKELQQKQERKKKRKEMDQSLDAYLYGIGGQKFGKSSKTSTK